MAMVVSLAKVILIVWFFPAVKGDSHMCRSSLHVRHEEDMTRTESLQIASQVEQLQTVFYLLHQEGSVQLEGHQNTQEEHWYQQDQLISTENEQEYNEFLMNNTQDRGRS